MKRPNPLALLAFSSLFSLLSAPPRSPTSCRVKPLPSNRGRILRWCETIAKAATPPTTSALSHAQVQKGLLAGRSGKDDQGLRRANRRRRYWKNRGISCADQLMKAHFQFKDR